MPSRREVLRGAAFALIAASALPLLEACGATATPTAPAPTTAAPTAAAPAASAPTAPAAAAATVAPAAATGSTSTASAAAGSGSATSVYPSYIPATSGPKPDFPSSGPQYEDGFTNYPTDNPPSWNKAAPGTGSNVTIFAQQRGI
ncbi:MAG TPA: hypothetical protein VGK33_08570, partial [Chloroflexota bacterium]